MNDMLTTLGVIALFLMWAAILAVIQYRRHMPSVDVADGSEWD